MGAGSAAPDVAPTPALPRKRGRETSASWDERMSAERRSGHGDAAGRQHASAPSPACGGRLGWGQDEPRRTSPPPRPSPASGGGRHRLRGTNGCQRNDEADTVTRLDGSTRAPLPPLAGEGWDGGRISRDGRRPHRGPPPQAGEGDIGFVEGRKAAGGKKR